MKTFPFLIFLLGEALVLSGCITSSGPPSTTVSMDIAVSPRTNAVFMEDDPIVARAINVVRTTLERFAFAEEGKPDSGITGKMFVLRFHHRKPTYRAWLRAGYVTRPKTTNSVVWVQVELLDSWGMGKPRLEVEAITDEVEKSLRHEFPNEKINRGTFMGLF